LQLRPRVQGARWSEAKGVGASFVSERLAVHRFAASVSLAAAVLATTLPAAADLPPAVARMVAAEAKISSFHVTAGADENAVSEDIVRSGDFAFTTLGPKLLKLYAVGNDLYFKAAEQAHFSRVPLAKGREMFAQILSILSLPDYYAKAANVTFADAGTDTLDGKPIHKIKAMKNADALVMWIGADDLIYAIDFLEADGSTAVTTHYSQFGALTAITPPTDVVDLPADPK